MLLVARSDSEAHCLVFRQVGFTTSINHLIDDSVLTGDFSPFARPVQKIIHFLITGLSIPPYGGIAHG